MEQTLPRKAMWGWVLQDAQEFPGGVGGGAGVAGYASGPGLGMLMQGSVPHLSLTGLPVHASPQASTTARCCSPCSPTTATSWPSGPPATSMPMR